MFSHLIAPATAAPDADDAVARFLHSLRSVLAGRQGFRLSLARPEGGEPDLERLMVREIELRGERALSFLWRYKTRDITKNHGLEAGLDELAGLLGHPFQNAHLLTDSRELQLAYSRKGRPTLRVGKLKPSAAVDESSVEAASHDRSKQRHLAMERPVWRDLGLTHEGRQGLELVPAMSRKWKQINKFIEIFGKALSQSALASSPDVHVADFGSGKGYLTFAMHDYLRELGKATHVLGVELREDMVRLCNEVATRNACEGLRFDQGDVREYRPERLDVMIALHACDIATDFAIHLGLRAKAQIIMCSPCCHKQLRPQMQSPSLLKPLLQHGIHLGQEAEMITDGLRALLLESEGYDTQVFEFISLEHTSKNKMILAVRRPQGISAERRAQLLAQIEDIKRFYGIREQALQDLLAA
ncbi:SAM-dependent methyltransferase [Mitsuaria sp. WAJ17]|uniref:class I SAM-dependent methyltransferase n=1 Tax=Mitsuaria sp. WAJ17 TaxID=2761452 RepID=UPI001604499D|nr:SAM-dependent methyltransferase [Mitsuaria sp. WAJ17]MBB2484630.1 SAM-dependent methyltransferase [Mitsuaria sp. WAJ17]